jgi:hypothetical protein
MLRVTKVPAYHALGCKIHPLSTSSLLQTYIGEQIILDNVKLTLSGESRDPTHGAIIAMNCGCTISAVGPNIVLSCD